MLAVPERNLPELAGHSLVAARFRQSEYHPMFMKLAVAIVLSAICLPAQKPGTAPELVIKRLSNPDAAAADAAVVDLIRGGTANAPVLREALAALEDPQVRARAERALAICAVDAPVVNGVKIGLCTDRKELKPGETAAFTATLCNVSDAPVALFLGMSYSGNVLLNGLALQRLDEQRKDGGEQARFGSVGFCGTGAWAIVESVPPWSSKEFTLRAEYRLEPKQDSMIEHKGPFLDMGIVFLPVDPTLDGGKVKLRLHWDVDPSVARDMADPKAKPDWKGTLVSNMIEILLRERTGG
jgi:hypothetical protein